MNDFLNFRKMMTPTIIQIIFWIGLIVSVLSGIGLIVAGIAASSLSSQLGSQYGGSGGGLPGGLLVFAGLVQIVLGPFFVRIWCELVILGFRIYDTLTEIRDNTGGGLHPPYA